MRRECNMAWAYSSSLLALTTLMILFALITGVFSFLPREEVDALVAICRASPERLHSFPDCQINSTNACRLTGVVCNQDGTAVVELYEHQVFCEIIFQTHFSRTSHFASSWNWQFLEYDTSVRLSCISAFSSFFLDMHMITFFTPFLMNYSLWPS